VGTRGAASTCYPQLPPRELEPGVGGGRAHAAASQGPLESRAFERMEDDRGGVGEPQLMTAKIGSRAATWEGCWIAGHLAVMVPVFDTVECVVWIRPTKQEVQECTKALFSSSRQ
jgi:hypothetical protein